MSCFPVCSESLPQMSLQQDNAFKSPWKSTSPAHMWGTVILSALGRQALQLAHSSLRPHTGLAAKHQDRAQIGGGGCLQAPPEPRTFSTSRGLGFVVQPLLGGLAERTGANPTILRGEDLSISMPDLNAVLASFGPWS